MHAVGMLPNHSEHCHVNSSQWAYAVYLSCPQATTYKLDFEQERSDREEVMGRFEGERQAFQADIVKLEGRLKAMERNDTLAQLSSVQRKDVRNQVTSLQATLCLLVHVHIHQ